MWQAGDLVMGRKLGILWKKFDTYIWIDVRTLYA